MLNEDLSTPEKAALPAVPDAASTVRDVAPRPHWWTVVPNWVAIAISILSVVFSSLGWYETSQNRKLNEATSRAYVKVSSLLLDLRTAYTHPNPDLRTFLAYLTVINTGRIAARRVRIERAIMTPSFQTQSARADGLIGQIAVLRELAPGGAELIELRVPLLVKGDVLVRSDNQITLNIGIAYNDGVHPSDKLLSDTFCALWPRTKVTELLRLSYCVGTILEMDESGKPQKHKNPLNE